MSHLVYLIGKSLGNIFRRPLSAVTSLISLTLLFLMLDFVWISHLSGQQYFKNLNTEIDLELFLDDSLSDSTITTVVESISRMDGVEYMVYISKEDAREKLFGLMGTDLLEGLESNPLPRSIKIDFDSDYVSSGYLNEMANNLKGITGVNEIFYPIDQLEKAEYSRSFITKIAIFMAALIMLAVVLNLLHSIRLSVRARHEELFQLRLLGAGRGFLSLPYILESLLYTVLASVSSWLIVFYASQRLTFRNIEIILPGQIEVIYFCLIASFVGIIVGHICIRRSL